MAKSLTFLTFLLLAASPAVHAHPTAHQCPAEDIINGCDGGDHCLYPHWDGRYFWQCDQTGASKANHCPGALMWNQRRKTCDWQAAATTPQSAMTAGIATFDHPTKQVRGLTADLGLINEPVVFKTMTGVELCTAKTGPGGVATCNSATHLPIDAAVLLRGYTASYAGNAAYKLQARTAPGQVKG
jgi:hypothetical protein